MARLFTDTYEEEITKKDIEDLSKKNKAGIIVEDVPGGTDVSIPIRIDYMNGDYHKAFDLLKSNDIPIKYKTVMTVPPFHATLHMFPSYGLEAMQLLLKNKIKMYKAKPVF
jgi:hypothetical protein|tara:strand:+ start:4255 stop:4587 length:333 start_codon:yes stop_codon:yes gene_type:complete